jgi:hypothetical protein
MRLSYDPYDHIRDRFQNDDPGEIIARSRKTPQHGNSNKREEGTQNIPDHRFQGRNVRDRVTLPLRGELDKGDISGQHTIKLGIDDIDKWKTHKAYLTV